VIVVDAGNSRLKWAHPAAGAYAPRGELPSDLATLEAALGEAWAPLARPDRVVACAVAGGRVREAVDNAARDLWRRRVDWVRAEARAFGVTNAYPRPDTLGADRWVTLIAAHRLHPGPVCIVDCGTAVTLDALDASGTHLGGLIVPGSRLMRAALTQRAPGIPAVEGYALELFADNTAGAVAGGALHATAALVERFVAAMEGRLGGSVACLLAGGDGAALAPCLRCAYTPAPDLVLAGLALIGETAA